MIKIRLTIILFFGIRLLLCNAQNLDWKTSNRDEIAKEFEMINKWYVANTSYSLNVTYSSFEDYVTSSPYETSSGYFKRSKLNYHSFLLGTHTIQNKEYKLVIDSANLLIVLTNPDRSFNAITNLQDYADGLLTCKVLKIRMTSDKGKKIRLEFGEHNPIAAFEVSYMLDGKISEMTTYYAADIKREVNSENAIKKKPRLSVKFSNYRLNPTFKEDEFTEQKYISISKTKKPQTLSKYSNYKFSDNRAYIN